MRKIIILIPAILFIIIFSGATSTYTSHVEQQAQQEENITLILQNMVACDTESQFEAAMREGTVCMRR